MRILAGDPGKVNFALSIIDIDDKTNKLEIIGTKMCENPVQRMHENVVEQSQAFLAELRALNKEYGKFDALTFERFQSRGLGGNTIEVISLMIGLASVFAAEENISAMFITASQWKNAFNRKLVLNDLYNDYKLKSVKSPKTIHEFDSSLIGFYTFYKHRGIVPFTSIDKNIDTYMERFLTSSNLTL